MTALTKDRDTPVREGDRFRHGVAATAKIFAGSLVVLNATGYAAPGSTATGLIAAGRAEAQVDNSAGADGAETVEVRKGVFRFANDGTNPVTIAHIGDDCYIVDDQTVSSLATGRSVAGKVEQVDSDGVWVRIQ